MTRYDYDLLVLGAGSGGVRAARMSATYGAKVAVVEMSRLGGTCVNIGCIPKKLLVYAAHFRAHARDAEGFGFAPSAPAFSWRKLIDNKNAEIRRLNEVYRGVLDRAGVKIFDGRARVLDPHTVEVNGVRRTAETLLVAVGGRPSRPRMPGAEHCIVSDDVFELPTLPPRVLVVGGGYIGVEFAGVFSGLGSEVTLVHRGSMFLRGFDDLVRNGLAQEMTQQGISVRFGVTLDRVDRSPDGELVASLSDGSQIVVDQVLSAVGRVPNTDGVGLLEVGVAFDEHGAIVVDALSRSTVPNIYAVGDVTNRLNLTPMAIAEGAAFAETLYHQNPTQPDYHDVPTAVFSSPPIGAVGLTETEARAQLAKVRVYESTFTPLKHQLSGRHEKTRMKLVVEDVSDRVLGCHLLGDDAPEIVQGFAVALKCKARKRDLDATVGIHPTAAEELVTMRTPTS